MPNPTTKDLIDKSLDRAYAKAAAGMLAQIKALSHGPNSAMQASLRKLDEEAARLDKENERVKPDNAQLQQTMGQYRETTNTTQSLILANDDAIQKSGQLLAIPAVTAKIFRAVTNSIVASGRNPISTAAVSTFKTALAAASTPWTFPDAADFVLGYVTSDAWRD